MKVVTGLACASVVATVVLAGQTLEPSTLAEALALARTRNLERLERFHAGYRVAPAEGTVTAIEAITAYRRAVLVAEQQLREGSRGSIKELAAALVPFANRVTVRVDAKLHPQHTFYGPPAYRVELRALEEERIVPLEMAREPIYPLGTYPAGPGPNTGMVGVRVDATFDWGALMVKDCCDVLVFDELGRQVARQRVLFTSYR